MPIAFHAHSIMYSVRIHIIIVLEYSCSALIG